MTLVRLVDIAVTLGVQRVLDGFSLRFESGRIAALLGPSGSGKTTILRTVAGFVQPDSGQVLFDDQEVQNLPVQRRAIGMVFQSYALFPHLTVAQNIAFGLEARGVPSAEVRKRVSEALDLVRLAGLDRRLPRQLSGGQQQRVALARALVIRPRVLLLDEPLAALDRQLRMQMQLELRQLQRDVGITTLFVTHDQEEALTLADSVALLQNGRVQQYGMPQELYERPVSRFVAEFLGRTSLINGRVAEYTSDGMRVETAFGVLWSTTALRPPPGTPVTLAIRPEHVVLGAAAAALPNRTEALLAGQLYLGSGRLLDLILPDGSHLQALQPPGGDYDTRVPLLIGWDASACVVLER